MAEARPLEGRVALVTGGGGGLGRAHALALSRHGAKIVVNDFGSSVDGHGSGSEGSRAVVGEIEEEGGEAIVNSGDVGSWNDCEHMVASAIERFGALDIVVNNAGILRPKTLVGMAEEDLLSVLRVHLAGSFFVTHFAALHWRQRFKEKGVQGGRLINTTSAAGLFGFAQANYASAKAGIAALTAIAALELAPYGVTANAIAPIAVTRMSTGIAPEAFTPEHAAELVSWLATTQAQDITGRVFNVGGGHVSVVDRCHTGPSIDKSGLWTLDELATEVPRLIAEAAPIPDTLGYYPQEPRSPLLPSIAMPRGDQAAPSRGENQ